MWLCLFFTLGQLFLHNVKHCEAVLIFSAPVMMYDCRYITLLLLSADCKTVRRISLIKPRLQRARSAGQRGGCRMYSSQAIWCNARGDSTSAKRLSGFTLTRLPLCGPGSMCSHPAHSWGPATSLKVKASGDCAACAQIYLSCSKTFLWSLPHIMLKHFIPD